MYTFTCATPKSRFVRIRPWKVLNKEFKRRTSTMRAHQYPLRWFRSLGCIALACTCFLLIAAQPGLAQVDQGAITGLITDSTGAVVATPR